MRWKTPVGVTLVVLSLGILAQPGAGQQQKQGRAGRDARPYLPLLDGSQWEYRVIGQDGRALERRCKITAQAKAGDRECVEVRLEGTGWDSWEYWSAEKDGLYEFRRSYLGSLRGVSSRDPAPRLLTPLAAHHSWKWTEMGSVQTSAGAEYPPEDELRIHCEATIMAMNAPVEVPAGKYDAIHVRLTSQSQYFGTWTEDRWFARGVGLVLREDSAQGRTVRTELTSYHAGKPFSSISVSDAVRQWCSSQGLSEPAELTMYQHAAVTNGFRSRFVRLESSKPPQLLRVHAGEVTRFDLHSIEDWNRLVEDEDLVLEGGMIRGAGQAAEQVARAAAFLHLAGEVGGDGEKLVIPGSSTEFHADGRLVVTLRCQTRDGRDQRSVLVSTSGPRLVEVELSGI